MKESNDEPGDSVRYAGGCIFVAILVGLPWCAAFCVHRLGPLHFPTAQLPGLHRVVSSGMKSKPGTSKNIELEHRTLEEYWIMGMARSRVSASGAWFVI